MQSKILEKLIWQLSVEGVRAYRDCGGWGTHLLEFIKLHALNC